LRVRLMALPALVLVLAGPAVPAEAAGPWISPGNGAYLTSDTVTVNAQVTTYGYGGYGNGGGGVLIVDGVRRAFGRDLSYTIDGHQVANGRHYAIATSGYQGPWSVQTTFNMAVPPYAPGGVSVSASGTTVRVSWNKGGEPDLTGYSVNSRYGTLWVPASCPDGRCEASFKVPASADGDLPVSVVANRTGSGPSGPSGGSVRLVAAPKPKPHKTRTEQVVARQGEDQDRGGRAAARHGRHSPAVVRHVDAVLRLPRGGHPRRLGPPRGERHEKPPHDRVGPRHRLRSHHRLRPLRQLDPPAAASPGRARR
jgi:hypothetical protein